MAAPQREPAGYRVGDLTIDLGTRQVSRAGQVLALPRLSLELLLALIRRSPNVLSIDELMSEVWAGRVVNEETVAKRIELVREALGDDSRQSRYIALVRGHGYRLTAPVEATDAGAPAFMDAPRARLALAVLPLDDLSGDAEGYFAAGLHDALITDLSKARALKVISRTSTLPYHKSSKPLPTIAAELGVDLIVEGSVLRADDRVRITVQLVAANDEHVWAESYDGDLRDVLRLQSAVARAVSEAVKLNLTPEERARMTANRRIDLASYELYLKGRHFLDRMTPEAMETGLALLHRATQIDPADPAPYARLALAYNFIGHAPGASKSAFPRAAAAALQALGLDEGIADAHLALAEARLYFHWDWPAAEASFRRALELNPSLAAAHAHYAWLNLIHGRVQRAFDESRLAVELDPRQPLWICWHGWLYMWLEDFEAAARDQRAALGIDPNHPVANFVLGQACAALGRHSEALSAFRKAAAGSPRWAWGLAQGLALAGQVEEARVLAGKLAASDPPDPWALAEVHAALGDRDAALGWLEAGYESRRDWMPWMRSNYFFRPLFDEPRFREVVRRLDLPAGA
jgi:TolB-like protein/Flp pilus assembly protein TadD